MRRAWAILRSSSLRLGPYLVLEAVMPGGTLLALLLYLYRRASDQRRPAFTKSIEAWKSSRSFT